MGTQLSDEGYILFYGQLDVAWAMVHFIVKNILSLSWDQYVKFTNSSIPSLLFWTETDALGADLILLTLLLSDKFYLVQIRKSFLLFACWHCQVVSSHFYQCPRGFLCTTLVDLIGN